MLMFITAVKMCAEIALLALAGQALLAMLAGQSRARNPFYQLLQWLTAPLLALLRRLRPAASERRLRGWLAALLGLVWLLATALKLHHCLRAGVAQCL
jgi:hypothetical protein